MLKRRPSENFDIWTAYLRRLRSNYYGNSRRERTRRVLRQWIYIRTKVNRKSEAGDDMDGGGYLGLELVLVLARESTPELQSSGVVSELYRSLRS